MIQALVRFGVASPAAGAVLLPLMTRHMLTAPLDAPQQLAAVVGMPADLADLAASDASTGKCLTAGFAFVHLYIAGVLFPVYFVLVLFSKFVTFL